MVTTRTLEECLVAFPGIEAAFQENGGRAVVSACELCRDAWAAYYDRWLSSPHICNPKPLRAGLLGCRDATKEFLESSKKIRSQDREQIKHFLENIEFRLKLLDLLHDKGADAVETAIDERAKQFD